jgi:hypothetical protein
MNERRNDLEIVIGIPQIALQIPNSDRSPLYDVIDHACGILADATCEVMFRGRNYSGFRCSNSIWWSQTGSNRRPHACKARALPAELWPRTRRRMLPGAPSRSSYQPARLRPVGSGAAAFVQEGLPSRSCEKQRRLVGLGRLELPTSRLSSARSNQLSYKPLTLSLKRIGSMLARIGANAGCIAQR